MGNAVTNYFELSISVESGWNEFHIHYMHEVVDK